MISNNSRDPFLYFITPSKIYEQIYQNIEGVTITPVSGYCAITHTLVNQDHKDFLLINADGTFDYETSKRFGTKPFFYLYGFKNLKEYPRLEKLVTEFPDSNQIMSATNPHPIMNVEHIKSFYQVLGEAYFPNTLKQK